MSLEFGRKLRQTIRSAEPLSDTYRNAADSFLHELDTAAQRADDMHAKEYVGNARYALGQIETAYEKRDAEKFQQACAILETMQFHYLGTGREAVIDRNDLTFARNNLVDLARVRWSMEGLIQ